MITAARDAGRVGGARTVPPHAYFLVSAVFHYLGPAFAVLLFAHVAPSGVAWLRIAFAALVLAVWRRPWRAWSGLQPRTRRTVAAWGGVLALMNLCFYQAIAVLPLSTVAAIEFVPVIALAAVGVRSGRNLAALTMAVAGVVLLADVRLAGEPAGFVFAGVNALLFWAYIVLGHRVSRDPALRGVDGLALSMLVAALVALPLGVGAAVPAFADPLLVAAALGVSVCSSVVPYVADQLAMRRLARSTYALMVSLLPMTATLVGVVVLTQVPTPAEVAAVLLVIAGVALHRAPPP